MTQTEAPQVILIAGPNGAGKSTCAPRLLRDTLRVTEFVNADAIAAGLSAFRPEGMALQAGRILLARLQDLARQRADFAFETTLASCSFAPWIAELCASGYHFHLIYLWLPSPDLAVARVAERVRLGGHDIPEPVIRRRYQASLLNFFHLYRPLAATWQFYDNSRPASPTLIAAQEADASLWIANLTLWEQIQRSGTDAEPNA